MKKIIMVVLCLLFVGCLVGCTTTQCDVAKKSLATAQAAYNEALKSGQVDEIAKYGWTLSAAKATVDIWCSSTSTQVPK